MGTGSEDQYGIKDVGDKGLSKRSTDQPEGSVGGYSPSTPTPAPPALRHDTNVAVSHLAFSAGFFSERRKYISTISNHKEVHMDHIKLMIYGVIGIGVLVAIVAMLTQMLGIARQ
jgi:hypothetical protein